MWIFSLKTISMQIRRLPTLLRSSVLLISLSLRLKKKNSHTLSKVSIIRIALSLSLEGRARVLWMQCLYVVYKNGWGKKQAVWNSTFCGNNFFLLNLQFCPAMLMPQGVWKTLTYINDLLERLKLNFSFCQLKVIISSNKILEHMLMQIYTHHILKTKTKTRTKLMNLESRQLWRLQVCEVMFVHLSIYSGIQMFPGVLRLG